MPLTNLVASNTKPRSDGKQLKLFDSGGLFLLITPAGGKYWRMKYRWAGKEKLLALGVFPEVSLKDARSKRDAARRLLDENIDPSTKRRNDRLAAKIAAESSFKALALEWHRTKASGWAPRHAESVLKSLETYLFPDLGTLPVAEIEPMALLEVLRKIERTGKLHTAKRLRERAQAIFRLAIQTGRARHNPAAELTDALQAAVVQPRPALALQQLPGFLSKLRATDLTPHTRVLFAVIMVCFTRIGETVRARWEDLDLERGIWVIPPENRKLQHKLKTSASPHIVPIPRQIVLAFTSLLPLRGAGPFVFQNHHFPRRHMSESTPRKVLERMGYGGKDRRHGNVVTHGFRATASTILNEAGFNPDAVERQLSHIEQNQVRAAYNRAQYMDERRRMLQCWADYLDSLGASGQIVPLLSSNNLPSVT